MKVINFSHKLSEVAVAQLTELGMTELVELPVFNAQLDAAAAPLAQQVEEVLNPLKADFDGTKPVAICLHGMSSVSALVVSAISGLSGSLPRIVELRKGASGVFEVNTIIDLQDFRNAQRTKR